MSKNLFSDYIMSRDLKREIDSFKGQIASKERTLETIQSGCEHPIIAIYNVKDETSMEAKCVICKKFFNNVWDLLEATPPYVLDFYNYDEKSHFTKEKLDTLIDSKLRSSFSRMHPYPTAKEIYDELKKIL